MLIYSLILTKFGSKNFKPDSRTCKSFRSKSRSLSESDLNL